MNSDSICPGRYLAEDTLFLAATMVLATFTVFAPPTGRSLPVDVEVTSGVLS